VVHGDWRFLSWIQLRHYLLNLQTDLWTAVWGFMACIPVTDGTGVLHNHVMLFRHALIYWNTYMVKLPEECHERPHIQNFLCFWSVFENASLWHDMDKMVCAAKRVIN
jgi:hypothetical protein